MIQQPHLFGRIWQTLRLVFLPLFFVGTFSGVLFLSNPELKAQTQASVHINSGGAQYQGSTAAWSADTGFTGGQTYSVASSAAIANTSDPTLYRSERYGNFSYAINVPNGSYTLRLHFAEIYWTTAGQRIFNVTAEGSPLLTNYDIVADAGASNTAVIKSFPVTISDGQLNLAFTTVVDNAKVSAIELVPVGSSGGTSTLAKVSGDAQTGVVGSTLPQPLVVKVTNGSGLPQANVSVSFSANNGGSVASPTATTDTQGQASTTLTLGPTAGTTTVVASVTGISPINFTATGTAVATSTLAKVSGDAQTGVVGSTLPQPLVVKVTNGSGLPQANVSVSFSANNGGSVASPTATTDTQGQASTTLTLGPTAGTTTVVASVTGISPINFTATGTAAGTVNIKINSGGAQYQGSTAAWSADTGFTGGQTYSVASSAAIANTSDPTLYRSERYGNFSYAINVPNGEYTLRLHFAEIFWTSPGQRIFNVTAEGSPLLSNYDILAKAGGPNIAVVEESTVLIQDGQLNLAFITVVDNAKVSAIELVPASGTNGLLHVVITTPSYVVDYDGNGSEPYPLDGSGSHTHELGRQITGWTWKEGQTVLGSSPLITPTLATGNHTVSLTIQDNNVPPKSLTDSVQTVVYPITSVGGLLTQYYPRTAATLQSGLITPPGTPGYVETQTGLRIPLINGKIGNSPYSSNTLVIFKGSLTIATAGTYSFSTTGGSGSQILLNGAVVTSSLSLVPGKYSIEARLAIASTSNLPAEVLLSNGGSPIPLAASTLTHDETTFAPFINSMPTNGASSGGEQITISGIGFSPASQVELHWGSNVYTTTTNPKIVLNPSQNGLTFTTPPGSGVIPVFVKARNLASNTLNFNYSSSQVAVSFTSKVVATPTSPTRAAWGPDGRLYVATINGPIFAYTFDDNYNVIATQNITTLASLSNKNILGIAFNPLDTANNFKIYVGHALLYANGGSCFSGSSAYLGQVSVLQSPSFAVQPLIQNLPVSNHDHGINGMEFDPNGDLLIAVGGNTNAGVPACAIGNLPESPLTGAILKAEVSRPDFNGVLKYVDSTTGAFNTDQVTAGTVDVAPGIDVSTFASGLRNPFDLVWTTGGNLFDTDNGPNGGFGPASTSATTQGSDPNNPDEINLVQEGGYYGHPNRNRGRYEPWQNVYHGPNDLSVVGQLTAPLTTVTASTDGIDEYRATTFGGQLRGNLLAQRYTGVLYNLKLDTSGTGIQSVGTIANAPTALDALAGPGGAIVSVDYDGSKVFVLTPNDNPIMQAYDIFPWRAKNDGTASFVIGGAGFGSLANTTVTIGGQQATLTSVTSTRIKGVIPASTAPQSGLLDVVVQSNNLSSTIPKAFRYQLPRGQSKGSWKTETPLPVALGEVAAAKLGGVIYVVGEGNNSTYIYNPVTGSWSTKATRPFVGNHHAAEVVNGKLYLFGGLGGGEGQVQIYDPVSNSWSLGAAMPWAGGSVSSAVIGGKVYVAGGIVNGATVNSAAVYNPKANTWSSIASMPAGRNHAASATDGRRLFIFGGRTGGNVPAVGFNTVQIYDPTNNTWQTSDIPASGLPPLPQARGGMGKAAFLGGEFYVMGGETTTGSGAVAGNVYNQVDVYDPVAKTWRLEANMLTARHGIYPVVFNGQIWTPGGGIQSGNSQSTVNEIFGR